MAKQAPGSWLSFRRLKVWQKCALIAVPFVLPVAALLYLVISQNNTQIAIAEDELKGLEYLRPLKQVSIDMAAHRGLAYRSASGDKTADLERTKVAEAVDAAIREVDAMDAKHGTLFKTTEKWAAVKDTWKAVRAATGGTPEVVFAQHTDLIAKVIDVSVDVWEYSTLALDPVADTYYLQDIMIARGFGGMEDLGQLRGLTGGLAVKYKGGQVTLTDDERVKLNLLVGSIETTKAAVDKETRNAVRANTALKGKMEPLDDEYRSKADAFLNKVRPVLIDGTLKATPAEIYAAGTDAVNGFSKLYDGFDPLLVELLNKRAGGYRQTNYLAVAGVLVGLVLVALVAFFVTRAITRQVESLTDTFRKIEGGDYQTRAAVTSDDELGKTAGSLNRMLDNTLTLIQSKDEKEELQRSIMRLLDEVGGVADGDLTKEAEVTADATGAIADSFNHMIDQLRGIISRVQTASVKVTTATGEIRTSAQHLAGGAENQAEQIVHTSAAIDEMAVSIQQVADNATQSTAVAQQALATAKQGDAAVKNTIEGMNRIREQAQETAKRIKRLGETSQEIGQIVQLIDDIADRTGILALNASIQAAAAGDAGRGFAVVAEEVERLAVRATEATKKIAGLVKAIQTETNEAVSAMERNIQEVVSGSKVANQAGQALHEIEGVSNRLADLIQSITLATKQQARGSEALAKSMTDISQITQQTAVGTKQTVESVTDLAKLADDLRGSVAAFRLPTQYQNGSGNGQYANRA
jgi:twitching motility protein PilJ